MKEYYLKHKYLGTPGWDYLNYDRTGKVFVLNTKSYDDIYKTVFTQEEIIGIEMMGFELTNFESVEVEEED